MEIVKAHKELQKLRLAISGPAGSGKTFSALLLAKELGTICVIDTENGSAALYADKFDFDVLVLEPPYSSERFSQALELVAKTDCDTIIIDSLSHEWNGIGGCLDKISKIQSLSTGNSYTAWSKVTPEHEKLFQVILSSPKNIIVTMRSKMGYEMIDENGKKKPIKIGLQPIQRDGVEYLFTTVFELDQTHRFTCSKDRTGLFGNVEVPEVLDIKTGQKIVEWLKGTKVNTVNASPQESLIQEPKIKSVAVPSFLDTLKGQAEEKKIVEEVLNQIKQASSIVALKGIGLRWTKQVEKMHDSEREKLRAGYFEKEKELMNAE